MNSRRAPIVLLALAVLGSVTALGVRSAAGQEAGDAAEIEPAATLSLADTDALATQVYALFEANCVRCHGNDPELAGGLDLRTEEGLLAGGENGRVVVPHDPEASPLYRQMARTSRPFMPFAKPQLPDAEIELVRRWIVSGASLGGVATSTGGALTAEDLARLEDRPITDAERTYWAFVPPTRPDVPAADDAAWADNAIDAFLLREMRQRGLAPAPLASRATLVRRAYLDVLGLPPTPAQVTAFVTDERPDAWERLVDELLDSPHYGERWARHWMDVARYADSGGFEFDVDRPQMYRYRDYLVDSFNADKPYDRFVLEQLAGDELPDPTDESIIATGFLRVGTEAGPGELNRLDELDDLITATSLTFMGVTVGCARCHDHKFDPIAQKDYYRMQAVFYPTVRAWHELEADDAVAANRAELARYGALLEPLYEAKKALEQPAHRVLMDREIATLAQYLQDAWNTPEEERTEGQQLNVIQMESSLAVDSLRGTITEDAVVELMTPNVAAAHAAVKAEIARLEEERPARLPAARVIGEAGREPEPSYFLHRGSAGSPGSVMAPGVLAVASRGEWDFAEPPPEADSSWRRRGFAEWLVNADNPLTPRVMVNRIWQHHFGEGIVRTPSNFGVMGTPPSHPELLDWLAVEFVERDWSMKAMHRLMLTSRAYRSSSVDDPDNVAIDPENRAFWRMPRVRLEAEIIRDSILATAGTLDRTIGGPAIFPYIDPDLFEASTERNWPGLPDSDPSTWRRSLYVFSKRSIRYPMFEAFDQPNLVSSVGRRNRTTIAPQALILMNNPMVAFQATRFAERVRAEAGDEVEAQVAHAITLALARPPVAAELDNGVEYVSENTNGLADFCRLLFNLNEFLYRP
jgi:mono/diheme cytochrome c family protein